MHPGSFGESRDITKRQLMQWLTPGEPWDAHPMWFARDRPTPPEDVAFLNDYATGLDVDIIEGENRDPGTLLAACEPCQRHLLLDPDTGLGDARIREHVKHVTFDQFIQILGQRNRRTKLTLIYDQAYDRFNFGVHDVIVKLRRLRRAEIRAVAYVLERQLATCFIWASMDEDLVTDATHRVQAQSRFPSRKFLDDGGGHIA